MKKRHKHDAAFKAKAALEAVMNDRTVNEIAAKYQIHPCQVSQWKRELLSGATIQYLSKARKPQWMMDITEKYPYIKRLGN